MNITGHIIIWGSLIALAFYEFYKIKTRKKREAELEKAHSKAVDEFKNLITSIYGSREIAEMLFYHENTSPKIRVGMPTLLVEFAWGKPALVKDQFDGTNRYEQWFYGETSYKYGGETRKRYKTQLSIENGYLTGWQDL